MTGEEHHLVPRFHVRHRRSLIIVSVVGLTCLVAWAVGLAPVDGVTKFSEKGSIAALSTGTEFRGDSSNLVVRPSTDGKVHVSVLGEYSGARPMLAVTQEDGHVLIVVDCYAEPGRKCAMRVTLTVPAAFPLSGKLSSGSVDIANLSGQVGFSTESGQVNLRDLSGPLEVTTLGGPVKGSGLRGTRFTVNSESGAVDLGITGKIASMVVNSGTGPTTLRLPKREYRISTAGTDDVRISVPRADDAYGLIDVTTQQAPIRISTAVT